MCSKYSDTIAREQVRIDFLKINFFVLIIKQIRELNHHTKIVSPISTGGFNYIIFFFFIFILFFRSNETR